MRARIRTLDSLKKAGPYIGPRGGKYADPQHKIPWKEGGAEAPKKLVPHPALGLHSFDLHVTAAGPGEVKVSQSAGGSGPVMSRESLKHFVNDLRGKVDVPAHPKSMAINAVRQGKAKFLGKGDDGLAFRVGNAVVKVSTTVPYQPFNQGHRTPAEAAAMLRDQVDVGNKLADAGAPVLRSRFEQHGDKGFQIKPYVEIPAKLTKEQFAEVKAGIEKMHSAGYAMNDDIQAGIHDGRIVFFDTGKAAPATKASKQRDLERLNDLARANGLAGPDPHKQWNDALSAARKEADPQKARKMLDEALETFKEAARSRGRESDIEFAEMEHEWETESLSKSYGVEAYPIIAWPMDRFKKWLENGRKDGPLRKAPWHIPAGPTGWVSVQHRWQPGEPLGYVGAPGSRGDATLHPLARVVAVFADEESAQHCAAAQGRDDLEVVAVEDCPPGIRIAVESYAPNDGWAVLERRALRLMVSR